MDIDRVGSGGPVQPKGIRPKPKTEQSPAADTVDISEEAREALSISSLAKKVVALPDVRPGEIEDAKNMVKSGEILSEDVARLTAREMLRSDEI
jgi:hypothetical protein